MPHYLTMSQLTLTEGFGAQMTNLSALYAISRKTGHEILFLDGWTAGKGMQLPAAFDNLPMRVAPLQSLRPDEQQVSVFTVDHGLLVDKRVFELDSTQNYDIRGLFGSYRYWLPVRKEVNAMFRFKPEIARQAADLLAGVDARGREIVSLHVRRGDLLQSETHVNLSLDYYLSACAQFKGDQYVFLVFSDDIDWCRQIFSRRTNFAYAPPASAFVDMCAMSLCHHHIIANSTFSSWAAMLNDRPGRRVVCPAVYTRREDVFPYVNYGWYPDDWTALEDLYA